VVSKNSKSLNILLAEDNNVNQRLAVKILEKYHHKVTVANNGLEALEFVKQLRFDVILMDVQMPVMGGFEATANIRDWEREKDLQRTPIIALTAHAMVGDREKCIQAQMDEYLSKPLKQNQLIQTILKCATLGGALLEHSHVTPTDGGDDRGIPHTPTKDLNGIPLNGISRRPPLEFRANTEVGLGGSPSIVTADQADPLSLLLRSHSG